MIALPSQSHYAICEGSLLSSAAPKRFCTSLGKPKAPITSTDIELLATHQFVINENVLKAHGSTRDEKRCMAAVKRLLGKHEKSTERFGLVGTFKIMRESGVGTLPRIEVSFCGNFISCLLERGCPLKITSSKMVLSNGDGTRIAIDNHEGSLFDGRPHCIYTDLRSGSKGKKSYEVGKEYAGFLHIWLTSM